jgi:hypothetical protein
LIVEDSLETRLILDFSFKLATKYFFLLPLTFFGVGKAIR